MHRGPEWELLRELAAWEPEGGVVSVYVEIDPADRGAGWRIALRHQLAEVPGPVAERVLRRLPGDGEHPSGRTQVGFLEVEGEREQWTGAQLPLDEVRAVQGPRPLLTPLLRLLEDGAAIGVVVASLERIRVLEWALGRISELEDWELEITSLDWRERKAPQRNPQSGGTGATATGRDQYAERLDHNRQRFLKQGGELIASRFADRAWRRILVIGDGDRPRLLADGLGAQAELVHEVRQDLIGAPARAIGARVAEELEHLNRTREERLLARLEGAIGAERSPALGPDEVLSALEQGRAEEVIFAAGHEFEAIDGWPFTERLITLATATGAGVTPAAGLAAAALAERDGTAALLRY